MTPPDSVGGEFLATRRRCWAAQLERLGVPQLRADQLAVQLFTGADMRTLLRELSGAVAVVGSLAASAVALFLL